MKVAALKASKAMDQDVNSMIIAKDQFLSWAMISAQRSDWVHPTSPEARYPFFQARNAIYHSLNLLGIERGSHVLAPSYICRAAIDPLITYGLDVGFYPVRRDCSIDLRDLAERITSRTQAIMIVHYFGFPQPIRLIRNLCDKRRLALIEDCAHVLSGEGEGGPLGTVGDAAVFSWRKFLPIYDGAELVINKPMQRAKISWTSESGLFTLKVAANMLDASLVRTRQPILKLAHQCFRASETTFRKCTNWRLRKSPMMQAEPNDVSFDLQSVNWPMSRLSRWTKNHLEIRNIICRRRRNYETLLHELGSSSNVRPLFTDLQPTVCPWTFPVLFPDLTDAHILLRRRGIPAVTWGGVRHPRVARKSFADTDFLYDNLVFLPVHQCLQDEDIVRVARTVRRCATQQVS